MSKLLSISKNITKSAIAFGLMIQSGYAMDAESIGREVTRTFATTLVMAKQVVELIELRNPPVQNSNAPLIMRTGFYSVDQELESSRKADITVMKFLVVAEKGMEFETEAIANQMDPDDLSAANEFLRMCGM